MGQGRSDQSTSCFGDLSCRPYWAGSLAQHHLHLCKKGGGRIISMRDDGCEMTAYNASRYRTTLVVELPRRGGHLWRNEDDNQSYTVAQLAIASSPANHAVETHHDDRCGQPMNSMAICRLHKYSNLNLEGKKPVIQSDFVPESDWCFLVADCKIPHLRSRAILCWIV